MRTPLHHVSEDVNPLRIQGARGELTREEALQQLLRGTGLSFRYLDEMTIIIVAASGGSNASASPSQSAQGVNPNVPAERSGPLRSNTIAAPPADKPPTEEITVTGSRLHLGRAAIASPLTVITEQEIETMGFNTVEDVIGSLPEIYSGINAATTLNNNLTPSGAGAVTPCPTYTNFSGIGVPNPLDHALLQYQGRQR